jgi:DNA helicase II / ATP-dependent DNA helicase PcrA
VTAHEDDLAYESEVNREYVAWLERRAGNAPLLPQHRLGYRAAPGSRRIDPDTMCLVGRVRLDYVDPDLGHPDFYVGPAHRSDNGRMTVFSWVAPVAHSFFGGAVDPHEFSQHVVVRRTMVARRSDIVALHDERARPLDGMAFPADAGTHLIVPEAPPRVRRPRAPIDDDLPEVGTSRQDQPLDDRPIEIVPTESNRPSERRPPTLPAGSPADATRDDEFVRPELHAAEDVESTVGEVLRALNPDMRATEAVMAAITAPRAERLSSVLATLQPDQYDLVIRPAHPPLVVQGHPGTGKTVIAAHRAAYLVHPDRKARLDRSSSLGPRRRT